MLGPIERAFLDGYAGELSSAFFLSKDAAYRPIFNSKQLAPKSKREKRFGQALLAAYVLQQLGSKGFKSVRRRRKNA